jgi:phage repressor protein C with HTH and peptisase S24 domain
MQLKHTDIWRAIDRLAERNDLTPSGLARKAGLSPTAFNPSKRLSLKRKRWPSTESIAHILLATNTDLEDFVMLAAPDTTVAMATRATTLPMLNFAQAGREGYFDEAGYPSGPGWEDLRFPAHSDPHIFALEINGKSLEPIFREGTRLILSPALKPQRGDRVVVCTGKGEVLVRQLGRENTKSIDLVALNTALEIVTIAVQEIEWMYSIVWASQ